MSVRHSSPYPHAIHGGNRMQSPWQFLRTLWSKEKDLRSRPQVLLLIIRPQGQGLSSITTTLFACPWSFAYGRLILSFVIIIIILLLLIILRSFLLKPRNSCLELPSWHRCFIGHCYRLQTQVFKLLVGLMLSLLTRLCNLGTSIRAGLLPWCPGQHIFRYTIFANISLAVFHLLSVYVCFYLCSQINLIWFEYGHVVRWMECFFLNFICFCVNNCDGLLLYIRIMCTPAVM